MKDKFIRILSPMTLAVVILLDLAVIGYGVFAVYRLTQCVYDAAEKRLANRNGYNLAGALDGISLTNTLVGTQHNDRD